jgi:hypothetical protein
MTAAFLHREIRQITEDAERHFGCHAMAMGERDRRNRERKRRLVNDVADRFFRAMLSDNPPKTRDQAVRMALPIGWLILSLIWKTLALEIARWLWEQTQEP